MPRKAGGFDTLMRHENVPPLVKRKREELLEHKELMELEKQQELAATEFPDVLRDLVDNLKGLAD